jgi:NAD(P)-dependent dehydrogenase (short-subunit alcohol dehydrogenase family)
MMSAFEFRGLTALVTGGSSGIGLCVARELASRGAGVIGLDRQPPDPAEPFVFALGDVTDADSIAGTMELAERRYGGLDIVVNNAAVSAVGTIADDDLDRWRDVFDVNVFGAVRVSRAALPLLRRSAHACVVNICSIAASAGLPQRALYSAGKGALHSLTLAMAADHLAEGIRVNCVHPGTADTPWVHRLLAVSPDPVAARAALERRQPTGRLVSAPEVADAVAYLASPRSGSTTGASICVDGGMAGLRMPARPDGDDQ